MQTAIQATPPKVVHTIPATINLQEEVKNAHKQLRVAAYCRVSTKQEDQLNSYDVQRRAYTDKINGEPGWTMVGIYADKGITGTSVKKRDDFNRLMRHCKQGKVDMIITKSVARFARNTLDCLKHIADAPGQPTARKRLYGAASTDLTMVKNTATTPRALRKASCRKPS